MRILLLSACLAAVVLNATSEIYGQKISDKIPTLSLCELGLFPLKYDGTIVRVSATYMGTFESTFIVDQSCNGKGGIAVEYSCDTVFTCNGFQKQLRKFMIGDPFDGEFAKITAIGKVEFHDHHAQNRPDIAFHVLKIENVSRIEKK